MRPARPKCSDLPSDSVTHHAPDFVERSDPFEAAAQSILAQGGHALLDGRLVQLFRRAFDGRADVAGASPSPSLRTSSSETAPESSSPSWLTSM